MIEFIKTFVLKAISLIYLLFVFIVVLGGELLLGLITSPHWQTKLIGIVVGVVLLLISAKAYMYLLSPWRKPNESDV